MNIPPHTVASEMGARQQTCIRYSSRHRSYRGIVCAHYLCTELSTRYTQIEDAYTKRPRSIVKVYTFPQGRIMLSTFHSALYECTPQHINWYHPNRTN